MTPEVRQRMERAEAELAVALQAIERAAEAARPFGGARRPRLAELLALAGTELTAARVALRLDTEEVYTVCGRARPRGAPCTLRAGHEGDCAADYSAAYHLGPDRRRVRR